MERVYSVFGCHCLASGVDEVKISQQPSPCVRLFRLHCCLWGMLILPRMTLTCWGCLLGPPPPTDALLRQFDPSTNCACRRGSNFRGDQVHPGGLWPQHPPKGKSPAAFFFFSCGKSVFPMEGRCGAVEPFLFLLLC